MQFDYVMLNLFRLGMVPACRVGNLSNCTLGEAGNEEGIVRRLAGRMIQSDINLVATPKS